MRVFRPLMPTADRIALSSDSASRDLVIRSIGKHSYLPAAAAVRR